MDSYNYSDEEKEQLSDEEQQQSLVRFQASTTPMSEEDQQHSLVRVQASTTTVPDVAGRDSRNFDFGRFFTSASIVPAAPRRRPNLSVLAERAARCQDIASEISPVSNVTSFFKQFQFQPKAVHQSLQSRPQVPSQLQQQSTEAAEDVLHFSTDPCSQKESSENKRIRLENERLQNRNYRERMRSRQEAARSNEVIIRSRPNLSRISTRKPHEESSVTAEQEQRINVVPSLNETSRDRSSFFRKPNFAKLQGFLRRKLDWVRGSADESRVESTTNEEQRQLEVENQLVRFESTRTEEQLNQSVQPPKKINEQPRNVAAELGVPSSEREWLQWLYGQEGTKTTEETNISSATSGSSEDEENPDDRRKRLQREAKRKYRAGLPDQKKEEIKERDALRKLEARQRETPAETERRRVADTTSHWLARQQETAAETERRLATVAASMSQLRQQETPAQTEQRRLAAAASYRDRRDQLQVQGMNVVRDLQQRVAQFDETSVQTHYCGRMNVICQFCGSRNFAAEKPQDGKFTYCCRKGTDRLHRHGDGSGRAAIQYPAFLQSMLSNPADRNYKEFRRHIRSYNSSMSFASMGARYEEIRGRGPYVFKCNGQVYHHTSHVQPATGQRPRYAQLYVVDSSEAVDARLQSFTQPLRREILERIDTFFRSNNVLARSYEIMRAVQDREAVRARQNNESIPIVGMILRKDRQDDHRRYNLPTSNEVAMVFVSDDGEPPFNRDIQVYPRNPENPRHPFIKIDITNANLDPMTYAILFPYGEPGWHDTLQCPGYVSSNLRDVTILQYKAALTAIRDSFNPVMSAGNLTQQWIVDSYLQVEANNLRYIRLHQSKLRAEAYQGLSDYVSRRAASLGITAGRPVVLPSSFQGSPRSMQQRLQDAMAIFAKFGSVDAFVTFTANPKWKEISDELRPGETASDRPDVVVKVFKLKLKELKHDITVNGVLGRSVAWVYTIEFQKRGLPHAHILIVFCEQDKFKSSEKIDEIVSAELPDATRYPRLYEIVSRCMLHGPCGAAYPDAPCMENGVCSKNYPKEFNEDTVMQSDGYPKYRRRIGASVTVNNCRFDNRRVVPYNKYLLLKYDAHINVEVCTSLRAVKYIYKYIYKGFDCARFQVGAANDQQIIYDEVSNYLDTRYVAAPEAMWRLLEFKMHDTSHSVNRLPVHLENCNEVRFEVGREEEAVNEILNRCTKLTEYFQLNQRDAAARRYLYCEIPYHYTYTNNVWTQRRRHYKVISRMYTVSSADQERFYLRLLLLHVRGATSYESLRTVNGVTYETFKEAAGAMHLLSSDEEWDNCLAEAVQFQMPAQMRQTFADICIFCLPSNPLALWIKYKNDLTLDFSLRTNNNDVLSTNLALHDLEVIFRQHGRTCTHFQLPQPTGTIDDARNFDRTREREKAERLIPTLNAQQRAAFDKIVAGIDNARAQKLFYLNGPGGSGKTYLFETLISFIRGRGQKVLSYASTGIASCLLDGCTTVHSGFKVPVPVLDTSVSRIRQGTPEARLLLESSLIIIDEVTMLKKDTFRIIEMLLRTEIMKNDDAFGNKVIVFSGDWRQTLPVVPRGKARDILEACLKSSRLWEYLQEISLTENMRSAGQNAHNKWLLDIGIANTARIPGLSENAVEIPSTFITLNDIVVEIFGTNVQNLSTDELARRAILTSTNKEALDINYRIMEKMAGEFKTYHSSDSTECDDSNDENNYPIEFVNELTPSGMPPHLLRLKVGVVVILLRNLNRQKGLCNGTRLIVRGMHENFLRLEILSQTNKGATVFLSRIDITPSDTNLPFALKRRQFPIIPAFALTINKAQGQSFDMVGIHLDEPVFSHGQLYVALSRSRDPTKIKMFINEDHPKQGRLLGDGRWFTENIVYKEIFQERFTTTNATVCTTTTPATGSGTGRGRGTPNLRNLTSTGKGRLP